MVCFFKKKEIGYNSMVCFFKKKEIDMSRILSSIDCLNYILVLVDGGIE